MGRIFCFVNRGKGTEWQIVEALSEDGVFLAQHCSSHEMWAKHDIGLTSEWKHDIYRKYYPDGFELVWVDNPGRDEDLNLAHARHLAHSKEEYEKKVERIKTKPKVDGLSES